jgi:hypothetical protein
LFATFNPRLFKKLFDSLFGAIYAALASDLYLLTYDFFYGLMLPPRQPVGRPLHGRIVVCGRRHTISSGWPRRGKLRSQGGAGPHRRSQW